MMRTLFAASLDIDFEDWLKEWGSTMQIVGATVAVVGVATLVALRIKKNNASKTAAGPQPPSPPTDGPTKGQAPGVGSHPL